MQVLYVVKGQCLELQYSSSLNMHLREFDFLLCWSPLTLSSGTVFAVEPSPRRLVLTFNYPRHAAWSFWVDLEAQVFAND